MERSETAGETAKESILRFEGDLVPIRSIREQRMSDLRYRFLLRMFEYIVA